jgi:hypothetical protein
VISHPPLSHPGGLELPTIETRGYKLARPVLARGIAEAGLVLVGGLSRAGKTFMVCSLLRELVDDAERRTQFIKLGHRPKSKEVLVRLNRSLDPQVRTTDPVYLLSEKFLELAADLEVIPVIDEGHRLGPDALYELQTLHDRGNGAFPMVIIGSSVEDVVASNIELDNRVTGRIDLSALRGDELFEVLAAVHPMLAGTPEETLTAVNRRYCHGLIGKWTRFLETCLWITGDKGMPQDRITRQVASAALKVLERSDKKAA